jgi:hypothetical protein
MTLCNITFQVGLDFLKEQRKPKYWASVPLTCVLYNVSYRYTNVEDICRNISKITRKPVVRVVRLFLDEPITPEQTTKYQGQLYSYNL